MGAIGTRRQTGLPQAGPSNKSQSDRSATCTTAKRNGSAKASETITTFDMSLDFWHLFGLHVVITKDRHTRGCV
jgi:hypothetical protein